MAKKIKPPKFKMVSDGTPEGTQVFYKGKEVLGMATMEFVVTPLNTTFRVIVTESMGRGFSKASILE